MAEQTGKLLQINTSANAILALVASSTLVAVVSTATVLSRVDLAGQPDLTAQSAPDVAATAPAPVANVASVVIAATEIDRRLGFDDPAPRDLAHTTALAIPALPETILPVERVAPVLIIAGRPPVVPPQRPDRSTQIAAASAGAIRTPSPTPRPAAAAAQPTEIATALSPRPPQRPVTLSTSGEPAEAAIQTVALTAVEPRGGVTLSPPRSGANPCSRRLSREIPRRSAGAATGSAVMASLQGSSGGNRDNAIVEQALRGNVPGFLRELQPVRFTGIAGGRPTEIVICVTPDYLAIGSDRDNVRVPMGLPAALRIADAFDMMLPTPRMVDAIFEQADVRLSPQPMTPGAQMSSTNYFVRHDATLDGQMASAGARDGVLVAGHKKDVVIGNRLARAPGRVAIYGWHRPNGRAIQPLSTVHGEYYADYSHGIRLVSRTAYRDGRPVDLRALLTDGQYASLLNSDGPLSSAAIRLAALQ